MVDLVDSEDWGRVMDGNMAHAGKDSKDHFDQGMQLKYQQPDSIMDGQMKFAGRDAQDHFGMGMGLFDSLDILGEAEERFSSRPSGSSANRSWNNAQLSPATGLDGRRS
eukprot:SAG31_NODE_17500_length_668_cov_1.416520_1_plen_108_part_01